jgi:hypothetical protein
MGTCCLSASNVHLFWRMEQRLNRKHLLSLLFTKHLCGTLILQLAPLNGTSFTLDILEM